MQGVKRKNLSKACFLCQKAQAACDEQQPCGRCIAQGVSHMCFFSDENKKKFVAAEPFKDTLFNAKDARKPPNSNTDEILALLLTELREMREEQRRLHEDVRLLRMQHEKLELRLINHPASSNVSPSQLHPHLQHHASGSNGIHGSSPDTQRHHHPYSLSHDHGHEQHPNGGCPQCVLDEANRVPSPSASAGLGNLGNHFIPNPSNIQANTSALTTTGLGSRGATVNGLVDIMEKLKANGGGRQFGLPTKGTENGDITSKTVATKNNNNQDTNSTLIVVFDLSVQPPTVMTATDNFCKIMGYEMHEVVGMPWHKFIHPNHLQRTMNILNQANMNTSIQFPQLYKTKDGHMFKTLDTHKIFYDGDGRPISDIVSICLLPSKVTIKDRGGTKFKEPSTALSLRYSSPLIYSFNSPPGTPSPGSSPVVTNTSTEIPIPTPSLEEITNTDNFYNSINQPIVEDLNMNSPAQPFIYPPSPVTPGTPSISNSSPTITPSPIINPHHINTPLTPHPPPFTIDDPSTVQMLQDPTPLSSSTASLINQQTPTDSFENQVAMDDDELYRFLIPHEVRPYPLEEWLAQTHISPSPNNNNK